MDWLTGGRFGSCRLSAMFCIISIFAWWIFLVSSFILFFLSLKRECPCFKDAFYGHCSLSRLNFFCLVFMRGFGMFFEFE